MPRKKPLDDLKPKDAKETRFSKEPSKARIQTLKDRKLKSKTTAKAYREKK
jgi:hypothetical protein